MHFCPFCGTLLLVEQCSGSRLFCPTCPYVILVHQPMTVVHDMTACNKKGRDQLEDDFNAASNAAGGAEGGQTTVIRCESGSFRQQGEFEDDAGDAASKNGGVCNSMKAYFIQIQMRSADEPPTTFYKCTECGFQWRSND